MIEVAPNHKRGLVLKNPLMNAAGVLGFAAEYRGLVDFAALGAFVTNPLTFNARTPAAGPNAMPLPDGRGVMIHTGLPNPGVRAALRRYAREWARLGPPVIVHLAATTPDDVRRSVDLLERDENVSGVELGLRDDVTVDEMTSAIRAAVGGPPLIARLPVLRAAELCAAAAGAGADALTIGAPQRDSVDMNGRTVTGRIYGPDQFPRALEAMTAVAAQNLGLPIIGAGGVFSKENVLAMLEAGAVAVQLDAAVWRNPAVLAALAL
jgi:dihydroorotate dehydrogenase (NAD+) catalytic subunit